MPTIGGAELEVSIVVERPAGGVDEPSCRS